MKISITRPPARWWPEGLPTFENNRAMEFAADHRIIPSSRAVAEEFDSLQKTLEEYADVHVFEFPSTLDRDQNHDFVFCRDSFVAGPQGVIVMSRFQERQRDAEAKHYLTLLRELGYDPISPPDGTRIEGGECFALPAEDMLITGVNRMNDSGASFLASTFGVKKVYTFATLAFHLDTSFCPVLDENGRLIAALAYVDFFTSSGRAELDRFAQENDIQILELHAEDSVGPVVGTRDVPGAETWIPPASMAAKEDRADFLSEAIQARSLGQYCVNCLSLPGVLIGTGRFVTPGIDDRLHELGIKHLITPLSQYRYSAGGVHCATNELP